MNHIRDYRVLPWAAGQLTWLERIAKFLTSFASFFSLPWLHENSWSYYNDPNAKKQHKSWGIALTTYRYRRAWPIFWWFSSTPVLVLYTILLVIILFLTCTPLARSSTEHVFRYSLPWKMHRCMKTSNKPRSGGITRNIDRGCACF